MRWVVQNIVQNGPSQCKVAKSQFDHGTYISKGIYTWKGLLAHFKSNKGNI